MSNGSIYFSTLQLSNKNHIFTSKLDFLQNYQISYHKQHLLRWTVMVKNSVRLIPPGIQRKNGGKKQRYFKSELKCFTK